MDILKGQNLINNRNCTFTVSEILKKTQLIVYFFSSSYVPDTGFIEKIKEIYDVSEKKNFQLEVIFVSLDVTEVDMLKYFKTQGDWYAIPFGSPTIRELVFMYGITSMPAVVVVKQNGEIITKNGRKEIEDIGVNVLVTWTE